ncbi:MAG: family 10 glycosylhydrolase [Ruminococcus sp.]|nr:family 10 glycosylhydrolase [Ruminococcus sp.]
MLRRFLIILISLGLVSCSSISDKHLLLQRNSPLPKMINSNIIVDKEKFPSESKYSPLNYEKVKAVWISYLELADIVNKGEDYFSDKFSEMCSNCADIGFNTLYVHVRAFSDAFYPSSFYSYSKAFGDKPFDALKIMVEEAHKLKLSFHAWINPLRCENKDYIEAISKGTVMESWLSDPIKYESYMVYVKDTLHYWMNPAIYEVRDIIAKGAGEIARNYDVDGVHIDDYFYPTTEAYFDAGIYVESGTDIPLNEWRLENTDKMVKAIYNAVKSENSNVEFGISPQGNILNNYNYMFADVKRWCREEGFADYIVPQIYFGYENKLKPFDTAINEWVELERNSSIKMMIGIGAYKIASEEEFINDVGITVTQAKEAFEHFNGVSVFSYRSLFGSSRADKEREALKEYFSNL